MTLSSAQKDEVVRLVKHVLDLGSGDVLDPDADLETAYDADSLARVEIVTALEDNFNVVIDIDHISTMTSLAEVIKLVESLVK